MGSEDLVVADSEAGVSAEDFNKQIDYEVKRMGLFSIQHRKREKKEKKKKKKSGYQHDPIINCPRCNIPMIKKTKMGVTIDKCKKCGGIWLDSGEIEKILIRIKEENKKKREII